MTTAAEIKLRLEAERSGVPFLELQDGDGLQVIVALPEGAEHLTVGRRPECDVPLPWDAEVSRLHAQLERAGRDWIVIDEGLSRNGTYVNGERVAGRRRLRDGDRLCFGETPVAFRAPGDAGSVSTAAISLRGGDVALTPAQRGILVALCRPLRDSAYAAPASNREIAEEVHLSVDAVKAHLRAIFERFGLDELSQNQKRARLAAVALVNGIVRQHEF